MPILLAVLLAVLSGPALGSIVAPCQTVQRAIRMGGEAEWLRQCVAAQQARGVTGDAGATCRQWLERCRHAPPVPPGGMTY